MRGQPAHLRLTSTLPVAAPPPKALERSLLLLANLDSGPGADRADATHGKAALLPKSGSAVFKARRAHAPPRGAARAGTA